MNVLYNICTHVHIYNHYLLAANFSEELTIASTVIRDGGFRLASSDNGFV